jgi:cobalt-zinc-cadmium efflux system membrane fusion protein
MKPTLPTGQRKMLASIILIALALGAAILLWKKDADHGATESTASSGTNPQSASEADAAPPGQVRMTAAQIRNAGIELATAAAANISDTVELPGEIAFNEDRTAHIVPRLPGVAVSVSADLGQSVRKGQILAVLASPELAELRSASLAAQRRLELARLTYAREKGLWEGQISAEQDYLQAQQALREAEIQARNARAKLTALDAVDNEATLNRHVLRAPFDGVIVEKHIAQGEAVKEDANVFLISDLSTVWVDIAVTPGNLEAVRTGVAALVKATGTGSTASGSISYVGNLLGEQTRSAKARVVIANPQRAWRPGLFVSVAIQRGQKAAAVTVQADAIHTQDGKSVVYLRNADGFTAQAVSPGSSDGRLVEILDGVRAGASYAAKGSYAIKAEQGKASAEHGH